MPSFEIIPYACLSGKENMDLDESIFESAIANSSDTFYFRLYGWKPACVSLGRNQSPEFLDMDLLKEHNIDVVTRLTGGRALLHDMELTYSVVCSQDMLENGQSVIASYKEISGLLVDAFNLLGVNLTLGNQSVHTHHDYCMLVSTGADLNYSGRKFIGSAQCRKKGYILQHGSILYDYNVDLLETVFKEQVDTSGIIGLKEILPSISLEMFIKDFQDAISKVLSLKLC